MHEDIFNHKCIFMKVFTKSSREEIYVTFFDRVSIKTQPVLLLTQGTF